eukprot:gene36420-41213_t
MAEIRLAQHRKDLVAPPLQFRGRQRRLFRRRGVAGIFIHPVLFGGSPAYGFAFWFSTELVNYIAILPVMLTFPDLRSWMKEHRRRADWPSWRLEQVAPLAAFAGSLWLGTQLGEGCQGRHLLQ